MDSLTPNPTDRNAQTPIRRRRRWPIVLLGLLLGAAIVGVAQFRPAPQDPAARNRLAGLPIPVLVATATQRDMPIVLDGLGTVQAYNSVIVKPMVDGPLVAVNFNEGQSVAKGDILARIEPRAFQAALDLALAKKAQDEALLANAKVDLVRYLKLAGSNYSTAQQADTQKALVAQYEALVRQDQAQVDSARSNLDYTFVVSPLDGRAGVRAVDRGNIVHASDATGLVTIAQLQPIFVTFTLPQQALPAVAKAIAGGEPTVLATVQGAGRTTTVEAGKLTVLDNQVDSSTGTIKLKATFPNQESRLWPGGFVNVRLQVDIARNAVTVPPAAVQRGPRGSFVYVIGADDVAARQPIKTGYEDEQGTIVLEGLKGGERVATDGASRLTDGSKAVVAKASGDAPQPGRERPAAPGAPRQRPPPG